MSKRKELGKRQKGVLDALLRGGGQWPGGGWVWGTTSETTRVLDSLVKRDLVRSEEQPPNSPVRAYYHATHSQTWQSAYRIARGAHKSVEVSSGFADRVSQGDYSATLEGLSDFWVSTLLDMKNILKESE